MYLPGVAELALGFVEYLNRMAPPRWPLLLLAGAGVLVGLGACRVMPWRQPAGTTALTLGLLAGCLLGGLAASSLGRYRDPMFTQAVNQRRDLVDTSICSFRLPSTLEYAVPDPERCFDAFYLNLARAGLRPALGDALVGPSAPEGVRVFLLPSVMPDAAALTRLRSFVENGGHLLVMESTNWVSPATIALLTNVDIDLSAQNPGGWRVTGADPVPIPARLQPRDKAEMKAFIRKVGRGGVLFVLGSEGFCQKRLGQVYAIPDPFQRQWYRVQFFLLNQLMETNTNANIRITAISSKTTGGN